VALAAADETVEAAAEAAEEADETGPMRTVRQFGPPQIDPSLAPGHGMLHWSLVRDSEAPLTNELPQ
jgi:hypothetical protein